MSWKQVVGAILNTLFRLSVSCLVVVGVYRLAMYSYHFGYMVFNDAAKEITPGRDITISIEMDDKVMDIAQTLETRGLIEDAKIFFVQERLSEYHNELQPGIYTLNTSMKPSELIAAMARHDENAADTEELTGDEEIIMPGSESEETDFTGMSDDMTPEEMYDENTEGDTEENGADAENPDDAVGDGGETGGGSDAAGSDPNDRPLRAGAGL